MDERYTVLVQCSFAQIAPVAAQVAECFCVQLFALDPSLRSRFSPDLQANGQVLGAVAAAVVSDLHRPRMVEAHSRALARQCRRRGLRSHDYTTAGVALLRALREALGDGFTPELAVAWARVYAAIAAKIEEVALAGAA